MQDSQRGRHMTAVRMPTTQRTMRIVIDGVGIVDIDRGLTTADGNPRVRVDVVSDFDRYGLAPDGRRYTVENAEPGPGVVWVTGHRPDQAPVKRRRLNVPRETSKGA